MHSWTSRAAVFTVALLTLSSPVAAASAASPAVKPAAAAATQAVLLNSDILFEADEDAGTVFAAEGHLTLKKYKGTTYHGTFVDNFAVGKAYKAVGVNVDPAMGWGKFSIATHAGTFVLDYTSSTDTATAPKAFGKNLSARAQYKAHMYLGQLKLTTATTSRLGNYTAPVAGTLSLTTDALGYVVPYKKGKIVASYVYTVGSSKTKHTSHITSSGQYTAPDCTGDGSLSLALPQGNTIWHLAATEFDSAPGGQCPLVANMYSGNGASYSEANFEGFIPRSND